jgi:malic enzyme
MEGKGCLFKKFAGIDVFDIELAENDPDKLIDMIAAMEPTLGGINLEDIKAPECFYIEEKLKERMNIPVFHDDQHGTAIISAAAMLNGLKVVGKKIDEIKVVCSGAGAAAISCLNLWCDLGVKRENITVCDSKGVIYVGRPGGMDETKARYAQKRAIARWAMRWSAPTSSSACPPLACSSRKWSRAWPTSRWSSRWPTRPRKSCRNWPRKCARTSSSPPAVPTM